MSSAVLPPSNLPGEAVEWGRGLENRVVSNEASQTQLKQKVDNGLRAVSGQLSVVSRQITELSSGRRSHTATPEALTVSATTPGAYPSFTRDFTLPPPEGGTRSATISVSASFVRTSGTATITIWLELLCEGSVIWRRPNNIPVGDAVSSPSAWGGSPGISDAFFTVVPTGYTNYTLRAYTGTFVSGSITADIQNLSITITYGDKL